MESDIDFALRVERETMREHAVATWGLWLEEQARARIAPGDRLEAADVEYA
jgi:hypothetical protein